MSEKTQAAVPVEGALQVPSKSSSQDLITTSIPGIVTKQIGSGEHAQNSIVYKTIAWSFIGGGLLSAASVVWAFCQHMPISYSEIKDVWSIFAPLITLALGYLFGKGR